MGAPFNATVEVEDTYVYSGAEGRVFQKDTLMTFNGTPSEKFRQTYAWNLLGDLSSQTYPDCVSVCSPSSPRTVTYGYTNGWLTSVPGFASSISYHQNGLYNQIAHTNGVTDTQSNDSFGMARPSGISAASGQSTLWSTGTYTFDGTGNIKKIGTNSETYSYDSLSRLIDGHLPGNAYQTVAYDNYGNITSLNTSGSVVNTPTSTATNRLTGAISYDAAGNLTSWNGNSYQYDRFNQMVRYTAATMPTLGGPRRGITSTAAASFSCLLPLRPGVTSRPPAPVAHLAPGDDKKAAGEPRTEPLPPARQRPPLPG